MGPLPVVERGRSRTRTGGTATGFPSSRETPGTSLRGPYRSRSPFTFYPPESPVTRGTPSRSEQLEDNAKPPSVYVGTHFGANGGRGVLTEVGRVRCRDVSWVELPGETSPDLPLGSSTGVALGPWTVTPNKPLSQKRLQ